MVRNNERGRRKKKNLIVEWEKNRTFGGDWASCQGEILNGTARESLKWNGFADLSVFEVCVASAAQSLCVGESSEMHNSWELNGSTVENLRWRVTPGVPTRPETTMSFFAFFYLLFFFLFFFLFLLLLPFLLLFAPRIPDGSNSGTLVLSIFQISTLSFPFNSI